MIWNLSANDANKATLVAAGAHMRIIRAMDRSKVTRDCRTCPNDCGVSKQEQLV